MNSTGLYGDVGRSDLALTATGTIAILRQLFGKIRRELALPLPSLIGIPLNGWRWLP